MTKPQNEINSARIVQILLRNKTVSGPALRYLQVLVYEHSIGALSRMTAEDETLGICLVQDLGTGKQRIDYEILQGLGVAEDWVQVYTSISELLDVMESGDAVPSRYEGSIRLQFRITADVSDSLKSVRELRTKLDDIFKKCEKRC